MGLQALSLDLEQIYLFQLIMTETVEPTLPYSEMARGICKEAETGLRE